MDVSLNRLEIIFLIFKDLLAQEIPFEQLWITNIASFRKQKPGKPGIETHTKTAVMTECNI